MGACALVAAILQMHLTRCQFPGGGLEVSHLRHMKLCVNPGYLVIETHCRRCTATVRDFVEH